eukprot:TRINITY_DN17841_c0_g1_i1.p1 TRINITY_DN17841_c0_g1~~TRINITY_DN17841_c0_g1_i1.p1  ORF type:complete len:131 (-),score=7.13 TRINITY_DN17841_c0_g1_i1:173-565(-)
MSAAHWAMLAEEDDPEEGYEEDEEPVKSEPVRQTEQTDGPLTVSKILEGIENLDLKSCLAVMAFTGERVRELGGNTPVVCPETGETQDVQSARADLETQVAKLRADNEKLKLKLDAVKRIGEQLVALGTT